MIKTGLIMEGGGMRGIYTSAILDYFLEEKFEFDYTVGVSAGAINAASFLSKQKERTKNVLIKYTNDPRYMGIGNLIKEGNFFSTDFAYNQIPNKLIPFDYDTFFNSNTVFKIGTTNCNTGEAEFFDKNSFNVDSIMDVVRASGSLPFLSKTVNINGIPYLDGGISDSIPVKKAIVDGCNKLVLILTRPKGYRKKSSKFSFLADIFYKNKPLLAEVLKKRYLIYNETLDFIESLEEKNEIFVIRPSESLEISRLEKDSSKLENLYKLGLRDAETCFDKMKYFLGKN